MDGPKREDRSAREEISIREERHEAKEKQSSRRIGAILGVVLGVTGLGAVGAGGTLVAEQVPWWYGASLGMATGGVLGAAIGLHSGVQPFIRRACLALGAFEFQRSYWLGGVMSLVALLSTLAEEPPWFVEMFAGRWVWYAIVGALIAPPVFTAISELAFWVILHLGVRQDGPVSSAVWVTDPEADPALLEPADQLPIDFDPGTLAEIDFRPGGLKRIIACFFANAYKSHFFSYVPHEVELDLRGHKGGLLMFRRGVLLATTADAADFRQYGSRKFDYIQVCSLCWILQRPQMGVVGDDAHRG